MKALVREIIARRGSDQLIRRLLANKTYAKFRQHYGEFHFDEDYGDLAVTGLAKESGLIRGEIVRSRLEGTIDSVLLPGENNAVKTAWAGVLDIEESHIATAGLTGDVDHHWNFEEQPPEIGPFACVVSQAMIEHLVDPFGHARDCAGLLEPGGHLVLHTVLPGFHYHRYPVDCVRFFPDWFEEVARRLELDVADKYIGDGRILYALRRPAGPG